ncbi:MAG: helix-turn-helix domain-containing protein [Spirochaetes bacterium]|nr:helix-turn-helix domain-containing protein [Spirochaetota bacterium]
MESIGRLLKQEREKNGCNIEQVARETHISKRYLHALEDEDFSIFPGETYIIGFLRNYADYLGLDPGELINLYKNIKIQEQPVPMDELLKVKPAVRNISRLAVIVLIAVSAAAGGYFIYKYFSAGREKAETVKKAEVLNAGKKGSKFVFQGEAITRWFNKGDTIEYELGKKVYSIEISRIDDGLTLKTGKGLINLHVGSENYLDLDSNSKPDIRIILNDIDKTTDAQRVNLGLYKIIKPVASAEKGQPAQAAVTGQSVSSAAASVTILESSAIEPFAVDFRFRGYCMLRYLKDNKERDERFFHKGEQFSLDIKNTVILWISNAGSLKVSVAGESVGMGRPGEVVTKQIKWVKNGTGDKYLLKMFSVY